jgi:surface antigen/LysM repeat protein
MALFDEIEPPSSQNSETHEKIKKLSSKKNKYHFYINSKLFSAFETWNKFAETLNNFFVGLKFVLSSGKFLPHIILLLMGAIVGVTNITQKNAAKAYFEEIVTVNPNISFAVNESVAQYTPIIKNSQNMLRSSLLASNMSDGFVATNATVATEQTATEEPAVLASNDQQSVDYIVQNGDTLSGLAMKYDVKVAYLKYVNNLDNENLIKPGVKLKIPSKDYSVSSAAIAKKEKERKAKLAAANRNTTTRSGSTITGRASSVNRTPGAKINGYPYGWCTYYVATRRYVPSSWGNARSWLSSAKRAGYATGSEPAAGAIVVTSESGWGHVAYVESVNGGTITISEMNYEGWGVTSRRTISANGGVVRGYVY